MNAKFSLKIIAVAFLVELGAAFADTPEKLACKVERLSGIDENESLIHEISNGPIDGDTYHITLDGEKLEFVNSSNGAKLFMTDISGTGFYADGSYTFEIDESRKTFVFGVHKANYTVDYEGTCKVHITAKN